MAKALTRIWVISYDITEAIMYTYEEFYLGQIMIAVFIGHGAIARHWLVDSGVCM